MRLFKFDGFFLFRERTGRPERGSFFHGLHPFQNALYYQKAYAKNKT